MGSGMVFLIDYWPIVIAGVSVVVWVVRIEAKAASNTREIERLWQQRKEDLQAAKEARVETNRRLDEMAADIKAILRKVGE